MSRSSSHMRSVFTVSQWHELEHQALILKYLLAGTRVPTDLIFPIQNSFQSPYSSSSLGYCSFYGKKVDPEPGRCRRSDGKKWRCAKDAYGDSKYCERHLHRGRNRSRKPVEPFSQTTNSSQSPVSATVLSVFGTSDKSNNKSFDAGGAGGGGSAGAAASYQNLPLNIFGSNPGNASVSDQSQLHLENIPYGIPHKDYRNLFGLKADVGEHNLLARNSLQVDSSLHSSWALTSSHVSLFPTSKASYSTSMQNEYPRRSFNGNEFGAGSDPFNQNTNSTRPFLEEFPESKGVWPNDLENDISKRSRFFSTQLSISVPMGSADLSGSSSPPNYS